MGGGGIHTSVTLVTFTCSVLLERNQMIFLKFVFIRTFTRQCLGIPLCGGGTCAGDVGRVYLCSLFSVCLVVCLLVSSYGSLPCRTLGVSSWKLEGAFPRL